MKTTIRTLGREATIERGVWRCDDADVLAILQRIERWPAWTVPDDDAALAKEVIDRLGGEVVAYDGPPPYDPEAVY